MSYGMLTKGMVLDEYIGYPATMQFDLVDQKIVLVMSKEDIEKYPLKGKFEFGFIPVYNTIFFLMKFGNNPWSSAPYSPHLSSGFEAKSFPVGKGLPLTIIQVCNEDGKIYNMSWIVLKTDFSNLLYGITDMIYKDISFDYEEHRLVIGDVYSKFETDDELAEEVDPDFRCVIE